MAHPGGPIPRKSAQIICQITELSEGRKKSRQQPPATNFRKRDDDDHTSYRRHGAWPWYWFGAYRRPNERDHPPRPWLAQMADVHLADWIPRSSGGRLRGGFRRGPPGHEPKSPMPHGSPGYRPDRPRSVEVPHRSARAMPTLPHRRNRLPRSAPQHGRLAARFKHLGAAPARCGRCMARRVRS